ncbi:MAG: hypothetical protein C0594_03735 [Marinilabiliales bacterium]|nr:MAG: hypothetical protein C0594_03735 [Marinilabiliales bacterium]
MINNTIQQVWNQRYSNTMEAQKLAQEIIDVAKKEENSEELAYGKLILAYAHFLLSENKTALEMVLDAIAWFEKTEPQWGYAAALYLKANLYEGFGNFDSSLDFCLQALKFSKNINFTEGIAMSQAALGQLYTRIQDFDNAIKYLELSLSVRKEMEDLPALASTLNRLGRVYALKKDFAKSEELYRKSLDIRQNQLNNMAVSWTWLGLGSMYLESGNFNDASVAFNKAINNTSDKRCQQQSLLGLGKALNQSGNHEEGFVQLEKAMQLAEELNAKSLKYQVHQALSEYYEQTGQAGKALEEHKKFYKLKEEVLDAEMHNNLKQQQLVFQTEQVKQEAEIFKLKNIELKEANDRIAHQNKDLMDSIKYAYRIQKAISPPDYYVKKLLPESFILYKPKDVVSGDFYFVDEFQEEKVIFSAVDCTGHGVPGALMSVIGYNWLVLALREDSVDTPGKVLSFLDEGVNETLRQTADESGVKDSMDLAVCVLDKEKRILQYAGAYNPLYYVNKGELHEIKADKLPIGVNTDGVVDIFEDHTVQLDPGDTVYIFSDGYADQFGGPKNKKFKYRQLREVLLSIQDKSMTEQSKHLNETLISWQGENEQIDDIIIIGVKV